MMQFLDEILKQLGNHSSQTAVAGGAVTSPIWLPWLQQTSELAALILPIAGCAYFIVQVYIALRKK